ncbi:MAG TPA: MSHA biogenesis protein MshD [Cellvibrio sp.]|nr:MSHA biogenesis protein MshD [Cellvibrio sp.]
MHLPTKLFKQEPRIQLGVSLIEMVVFIVVVSIALLALVGVYRQATINNVDPIIRMQALEAAQSKLDEILSLKYDENTPTGGIPACTACDNTPDGNMNDVDDYQGQTENNTPNTGFTRSVTITIDTVNMIKLIQVSVSTPTGETILLSAERANF